jgi:hypothetical protein
VHRYRGRIVLRESTLRIKRIAAAVRIKTFLSLVAKKRRHVHAREAVPMCEALSRRFLNHMHRYATPRHIFGLRCDAYATMLMSHAHGLHVMLCLPCTAPCVYIPNQQEQETRFDAGNAKQIVGPHKRR